MNDPFDSDSLSGSHSLEHPDPSFQDAFQDTSHLQDLNPDPGRDWSHSHHQIEHFNPLAPTDPLSSSTDPGGFGSDWSAPDGLHASDWQDLGTGDFHSRDWHSQDWHDAPASAAFADSETPALQPQPDETEPNSHLESWDSAATLEPSHHGGEWFSVRGRAQMNASLEFASSSRAFHSAHSSSSSDDSPYVTISSYGYVYLNGDTHHQIGRIDGHTIYNSGNWNVGHWTTDGKIYDRHNNLKGWVAPNGRVYAKGDNGDLEVYKTSSGVAGGAAYLLLVWCGGQTRI